jgi:hypothetical protein
VGRERGPGALRFVDRLGVDDRAGGVGRPVEPVGIDGTTDHPVGELQRRPQRELLVRPAGPPPVPTATVVSPPETIAAGGSAGRPRRRISSAITTWVTAAACDSPRIDDDSTTGSNPRFAHASLAAATAVALSASTWTDTSSKLRSSGPGVSGTSPAAPRSRCARSDSGASIPDAETTARGSGHVGECV